MSSLRKLDKDYWQTEDGKWGIQQQESQYDAGRWYLVKDLVSDAPWGVIEAEFNTQLEAVQWVRDQYGKEVTT